MPAWVHAAERAYVAAAVHVRPPDASVRPPDASASPAANVRASDSPVTNVGAPGSRAANVRAPDAPTIDVASHAPAANTRAHALAAAGAIASHYLAVGTPRSFGILIDDASEVEAAALSLAAHRAWFNPRDIRCASAAVDGAGAEALAAATGGRVVSLAEALACDIANVYGASIAITPALLRRGTHVNALHAERIDPELTQLATLVRETGLPALAAGLVDGRQLDELTIFVVDGAPIALAALVG